MEGWRPFWRGQPPKAPDAPELKEGLLHRHAGQRKADTDDEEQGVELLEEHDEAHPMRFKNEETEHRQQERYTWLRGLVRRSWRLDRPHVADIKTAAVAIGFFLLPSPISTRLRPPASPPKSDLGPTSHLNGVRGLAAFFVCVYHLSYVIYPSAAYGQLSPTGDTSRNHYLIQLPILNLFYMGHPWVAVFYVVSGYSLSLKPLKQARAADWNGLHSTLSSAAFRRGFRLFLPVLVSTFLVMLAIDLGLYEITRSYAESDEFLRNWREMHLARVGWGPQLIDWYKRFCKVIWVWDFDIYGGSNEYDYHLWTIAVEYRCSLVLFLCQLALLRLRFASRVGGFVGVAWFALQWARWDVVLFLSGAVLADLDLQITKGVEVGWHTFNKRTPEREQHPAWVRHIICIMAFVLGLFLMASPERDGHLSPGYVWLTSLIPESFFDSQLRFWTMFGGILYLASINNLKMLSWVYNTSVVQYLGRISFGLYLVHGLVIHTFGYWLEMITFKHVFGFKRDDVYTTTFNSVFVVDACIILTACVWVGDIFYRAVDMPTLRFARWLEMRCVQLDS